ncbi:hypothetical protein GDO81_028544 [Engystomops pustulosus]|uniref:Sodefrin-like factor n=1 Tax=Engystomops pustulosus TaxID=76066 RepID=A0AAV6Z2I9_ENGPU|nr:hypothetical protein GDO81_028733 [Engystomops pustulosus]KAG8541642.1 hypothetical protein GDO81_028544 [Engystomops pustulosus]
MKNLVFLTSMVLALVSGLSCRCVSCVNKTAPACTEETEVECLGDECMTVFQYINDDGNVTKSIFKGCPDEGKCNKEGSITVGNNKFLFYAECCKRDLCNNQTYQLPANNTRLNGKTCPSCYTVNGTEECVSAKDVACTGSENRCFIYRALIILPDGTVGNYSAKGCTNTFSCEVNFDAAIGVKEIKRDYLWC